MIVRLLACTPEYHVHDEPPAAPASPPGDVLDESGAPPADWTSCGQAYFGLYGNLPSDHPDVEPAADAATITDPTTTDWFDDGWVRWTRFDPSLDFGPGWWPVDDGLAGDPAYFSVRWTAWIRVWTPGTHPFVLGAGGDAWVLLDGEVEAEAHHLEGYASETPAIELDAGVYPLEVRFAHRTAATDGFRFRSVAAPEDVTVCAPEFDAP